MPTKSRVLGVWHAKVPASPPASYYGCASSESSASTCHVWYACGRFFGLGSSVSGMVRRLKANTADGDDLSWLLSAMDIYIWSLDCLYKKHVIVIVTSLHGHLPAQDKTDLHNANLGRYLPR